MPNLAGILDLRTEPTDVGEALETVARVLRVPGLSYQECAWHDARFGAVNLLDGNCDNLEQPAVSVDGNRVLFLDGDHSTPSVKADIEKWTPFVPVGCMVLFHDCTTWTSVKQAVDEAMRTDDAWEELEGGGSLCVFRRKQ